MPTSAPSRIFISYARKDGASLAQHLRTSLQEKGLEVWLDTKDIAGGTLWSEELDRAIDSCHVMITVLATGSFESAMCRGEQLRALDKGKRLIPVLGAKGSHRTTYLYSLQYRDFSAEADFDASRVELLSDLHRAGLLYEQQSRVLTGGFLLEYGTENGGGLKRLVRRGRDRPLPVWGHWRRWSSRKAMGGNKYQLS